MKGGGEQRKICRGKWGHCRRNMYVMRGGNFLFPWLSKVVPNGQKLGEIIPPLPPSYIHCCETFPEYLTKKYFPFFYRNLSHVSNIHLFAFIPGYIAECGQENC